MKVLIVFYSKTGNVAKLADAIAEGARGVEGTEVILRRVDDLAPQSVIDNSPVWKKFHSELKAKYPVPTLAELAEADAVIFGTPTRYGNVSAELKSFIDMTGQLWMEGKLVNKIASAFTSTSSEHGGQETTSYTMIPPLIHLGMILVSPGYADPVMFEAGAPYGATSVSGLNSDQDPTDKDLAVARFQGKRVAEVTRAFLHGFKETQVRITMSPEEKAKKKV
ncbi:MAG TPA: NAD(P)H:quinone oxidoreductase [Chroococcales cyanobacterium]